MMFIRVRGASPGDPLHEFDIPLAQFERHKDLFKVIDKKPVATQRPASHVSGVVPVKKSQPLAVEKNGEEPIAPSVGPTQGGKK